MLIEELTTTHDVYDISVQDNENFFANDILVHNCTESYSNIVPGELIHCCNLASIVVGRCHNDEEVIRLARLATYILDNGIDLTTPPVKEAMAHNTRYRTIGVGIQGLHDYLVLNKTNFSDLTTITKLAELIEYGCVTQSIELAKTRGAYPVFAGSEWDNGNMTCRFSKYSVTDLDWNSIQTDINKYGIRNSQLTSPAPNTTTSIFMDAAAGIQPVYSAFFIEDNKVGRFPVSAMYVKNSPLGYGKTFPKHNQVELTKCTGALQKFVDTGISSEFIFDRNNPDFSAKDLYDTVISAWKEGNKCIYYIRSIKPGDNWQGSGTEEVCDGCAG